MKMELRFNPVEMEANDDGTMTVSGYVNKTEQFSEFLGGSQRFKEKIAKGAFERAIQQSKRDIDFLAEHDGKKILSSTRNGSLTLTEDDTGLFMSATICPTSWGKDYYQLIESRILQNMSFGFRAVKDAWKKVGDYFERTVNDLELYEVSVVKDPAYSQSSISARGIDIIEDVEIPSDIERQINTNIEDIRASEEDIKAIADKLYEMLSQKVAEGHAPAEDTIDVEEPSEDPVDEVIEEVVEEIIEEQTEPLVESKDETITTIQEVVDEPVVDAQATAAKLRDFINQFKQDQ